METFSREVLSLPARTLPPARRDGGVHTFADLFCGIGGFHYAAAELGLECVFASDIDPDAARQYEHNFDMAVAGDITQIDAGSIPEHDLLFAGFPCQSFSIIGKRGGLDDRRGALFFEIVRVLAEKRPQGFVLENVKQLSSDGNGATIRRIMGDLTDLGYVCRWRVLNALEYGLPQKRERIFIIGLQDSLEHFWWPPKTQEQISLTDILEPSPDPCYNASEHIRNKRKAAHKSRYSPGIWHENKGGNVNSYPYSCALRAGASYNYLLVDGERRLTPREMLRLQGFPERFEVVGTDSQIRKQVGNAVPVPMIQAIIKQVMHAARKNQNYATHATALSA